MMVVDIKIKDYFIYVVLLFVVLILNCVVIWYVYFELDGSGIVELLVFRLEDWFDIFLVGGDSVIWVNLDIIMSEDVLSWKLGDMLLLNGILLIGCDVVYKCMVDMLNKGEILLVDFKGKFIYYVGLVDLVWEEVVGFVGFIIVICMDKFMEIMLV